MRDAKYIVYDTPLGEVPIIFPNHVEHAHVANMLDVRSEVLGAGFVSFESNPEDPTIVARCHGDSTSLGIRSRPDDRDIIQRALRLSR